MGCKVSNANGFYHKENKPIKQKDKPTFFNIDISDSRIVELDSNSIQIDFDDKIYPEGVSPKMEFLNEGTIKKGVTNLNRMSTMIAIKPDTINSLNS